MAVRTGYGIDGLQPEMRDRHPVVNHEGSSGRSKCSCGSWLTHWLVYTGNAALGVTNPKCVYMGCTSAARHGAHVRFVKVTRKADGTLMAAPTGASYIVPMCELHNNPNYRQPFFIHKDRLMIDDGSRDLCETARFRLNKNNYFHMRVESFSGRPACGCPSHLAHYRAATRSSRSTCVAMECGAPALVAAPLRSLDARTDRDKWLAPLCRKHAVVHSEIFIKRQAELALPKLTPDCGR